MCVCGGGGGVEGGGVGCGVILNFDKYVQFILTDILINNYALEYRHIYDIW